MSGQNDYEKVRVCVCVCVSAVFEREREQCFSVFGSRNFVISVKA